MTFWSRLRTLFRGVAPRPRGWTPRARLGLEALEERLAFSATPLSDPAYSAWRQERFTVDEVAVANLAQPVATIDPQTLAYSSDPSMQASGFEALIGLDRAFATYNYRGQGYTVAVIDTGIDYRHPALGGAWGARVIDGWDFVNNDNDPMDDNGHGTHVAGIIGSSNSLYPGVAPNVNLVALKVLGADGSGSFGYVEDALKWVINNQAKYNIVAVNLSLGAGNYMINPYAFLDDEFSTLKNQGVFIAAAAGNSFYSFNSQQGLGYPAISPYTVSVGAVWDGSFGAITWGSGAKDYSSAADRITSFTQRSSGLDLMAPGALITSTYLNSGYKSMAGTSMASPVVAGAAVLVHQALDVSGRSASANQDTILGIMQSTGVTVVDGDDENDNVTNTGLAFKRLDVFASLQSIQRINQAPTLAAIPSQTLVQGRSLVVTLNGSDANNDPLTYTARIVSGQSSDAGAVQEQLGLKSMGSYYTNTWGLQEKWLLSKANEWYILLPDGQLRKWAGDVATTQKAGNLFATLDVKYYEDPALLINAQPSGVPVSLSVSGNQLILTPTGTVTGSFTVEVTVSDGAASATRTFLVTPNNAPTLGTIADQSMKSSQGSITVTLSSQDADGDSLSYKAQIAVASQQAVQLKQSLGLVQGYANDQHNIWSMNEKWVYGAGGVPYAIFQNGEVRRYVGPGAPSLASGNMQLVATLDRSYWLDPSLLWNAPNRTSASPAGVSLSFTGNQLRVTPPSGYVGTFLVRAWVNDGATDSNTQVFTVTVTNSAPVLSSISDVSLRPSNTSNAITYSVTDADGDSLSYRAQVAVASQQAVQVKQSLGLMRWTAHSNDAFNLHGMNEKWLNGAGGTYYAIFGDGEVRRYVSGAIAKANMQLVATLDRSYWLDPSLLWNAPSRTNAAPAGVSFSFTGNQLRVTPPAGYTGTFIVRAWVNDGTSDSNSQFFRVTVANTAPVLSSIGDVSLHSGSTSNAITYLASDADGDSLSYKAQIAVASQQAVQLKQSLGLVQGYANDQHNIWGMNEKWVYGAGGVPYAIFQNGEVRRYVGPGAPSLASGNMQLVATLDRSYWLDPSLLWNAPSRTNAAPAGVSFSFTGNQLRVTPPAGYAGTFVVRGWVNDGSIDSNDQFFVVTVTA